MWVGHEGTVEIHRSGNPGVLTYLRDHKKAASMRSGFEIEDLVAD
jgi:hypothetical protein